MPITRIDHINIAVQKDQLEELRRFYVDLLGFEEGPRPDFASTGFWLYAGGRPLVHLSGRNEHAGFKGEPHLDHVAFRISDPGPVLERLERAGVPFRRSHVAAIGLGQVFLSDPAGTGVELNFRSEP